MAASGKSRMVSFRLSQQEYEQFRQICYTNGGRNVSELLRTAVGRLLAQKQAATGRDLEERIATLESQVQTLMTEPASRLDYESRE